MRTNNRSRIERTRLYRAVCVAGGGVRPRVGGVHHPRELRGGAGAVRGVQRRARRAGHHGAVPARLQRARARARRARRRAHHAHHLRALRGAHARARARPAAARAPR